MIADGKDDDEQERQAMGYSKRIGKVNTKNRTGRKLRIYGTGMEVVWSGENVVRSGPWGHRGGRLDTGGAKWGEG